MAIRDIKPGKYKAVAIKGRFFKSGEKQTPGVQLAMEIEYQPEPSLDQIASGATPAKEKASLVWTGWLRGQTEESTEKVLTRTTESLALVGWNEKYQDDGIIPRENFDPKAEVEVVVEDEEYQNELGEKKIAKKVIWINRLGGASFAGTEPNEVKNMMAGLDLKKQMMVARKNLGIKEKSPTSQGPYNHAPGAQNPPPIAAPPQQQQQRQATNDQEPIFDTTGEVPF